jgi:hypothetical protein
VLAAVALLALMAVDAPAYVERQYDRFVEGTAVVDEGDLRGRLTDPGNNGRLDHWEVALDSFKEDALKGQGAGTYSLVWNQERDIAVQVVDAHSLYLEVMGELGLVGLLSLALALGGMLAGALLKARGRDRSLYAAVFAVLLTWVVHAGIDWDWEMPVVTAWVFALGGAAIAAPAPDRVLPESPGRVPRILISLGLLVLALTPAAAALSQLQLNRSIEAFKRNDCAAAVDSALASLKAMSVRPEPWEMLGYCDVRLGQRRLALRAARNAIERDPQNWEFHYALAVVEGAVGRDPRPSAERALRLNPREQLAILGVRRFDTDDRRRWRREALNAPLRLP